MVILVIKATCVLTRCSLSLARPHSIFKTISQSCRIAVLLTYSCQSLMAAVGSAWAPRLPLSLSSGPGLSRKSYQSPWTTSPGGRFMKVAVFSSSAQKGPPKVAQLFWHILIEFSTKLGSLIFFFFFKSQPRSSHLNSLPRCDNVTPGPLYLLSPWNVTRSEISWKENERCSSVKQCNATKCGC